MIKKTAYILITVLIINIFSFIPTHAELNSQLNIIYCDLGLCSPDPETELPYLKPAIDAISQQTIQNTLYAKMKIAEARSVTSVDDFYIQYRVTNEKWGEFIFNVWYTITSYDLLQNETVVKRYSPEEMAEAINDGGEILQKIENKNQTLSFILKAYYSKTGKFEFIKKTPFPVTDPSPEYMKEYDSYIESLKKYGKQVLIVPSATKQIAVNNPDEQFCIDKKNNLSNLYDLIEDRFTYLDNALKQDYTSGDISALKTANTELNNALDQLVTFTKSEDCIKCKDVCDEAKEKLKTFNDRKQYLDKQFNEKITDWKTWVWQGLEDTFGSSAAFCMKKCDNLKYGIIERLVSKNLCQGFCMISEVFMNIVNWSFQFLKSAISTDTSEDYEAPDFQNTSL